MAKIRPMRDWLVVRREPHEKVTEGGIVIPGDARCDIAAYGQVVAVGSGRTTRKGVTIPPEVAVGDRVAYVFALERTETGKGLKASMDDGEFLIQEKDVLAVIEKDVPAERAD